MPGMVAWRRQGPTARPSDPQDAPALDELLNGLDLGAVPPATIQALQDVRNVDEALLDLLMSAGVLPTPDEALAGMLEAFSPLLRPGCDPISAELAGEEFMATLRSSGLDEAHLPDALISMIVAAERTGALEALAMSRVLAAAGPAPVRSAATAAADRLLAAGLVDQPWARSLGHPQVADCFGYSGPLGDQDVIAITFDYGRKGHAVSVLIDHVLGGGVKDCWVGDGPRKLRAAYEGSARRAGVDLRGYTPAEAAVILERALAAPPCPVEPDQIEDVAVHLNLLRRRVELLRDDPQPMHTTGSTVHRLKITLRGSKPPIWRRIEVPSDTPLDHLHAIVQASFGWAGGHLWVFSTPGGEFGLPDPELGHGDAARSTLTAVAGDQDDRIHYTYDFGDDWEHNIVVEDVRAADPERSYPRCVTGRRAGPPEDCGGMWGYSDLLEILADPDHPEHTERLEWLGLQAADDLDPARFDVDEVNRALTRLSEPRAGAL